MITSINIHLTYSRFIYNVFIKYSFGILDILGILGILGIPIQHIVNRNPFLNIHAEFGNTHLFLSSRAHLNFRKRFFKHPIIIHLSGRSFYFDGSVFQMVGSSERFRGHEIFHWLFTPLFAAFICAWHPSIFCYKRKIVHIGSRCLDIRAKITIVHANKCKAPIM